MGVGVSDYHDIASAVVIPSHLSALTQARARTHTHTHTQIISFRQGKTIYKIIFLKRSEAILIRIGLRLQLSFLKMRKYEVNC